MSEFKRIKLDWGETIGTTILYYNRADKMIFYTSNKNDKRMYRVERVVGVPRKLNIEKQLAGAAPCFLKTYKSFVPDKIPNFIKNDLELLDTDKIHVTIMQRFVPKFIKEKNIKIGKSTFKRYCYMLYWSYWSANTKYGFIHGNITPQNIIINVNSDVRRFIFNDQKKMTAKSIPMFVVPSTHTLEDKTFFPPELIMNVGQFGIIPEAHDIWSLTLTLLSKFNVNVLTRIGDTMNNDINRMIQLLPNTFPGIETFLQICFLQNGIGNGLLPKNQSILSSEFVEFLKKFNNLYNISDKYATFFTNEIPHKLQEMFRVWLSWDPSKRVYDGYLVTQIRMLAKTMRPVPREFYKTVKYKSFGKLFSFKSLKEKKAIIKNIETDK